MKEGSRLYVLWFACVTPYQCNRLEMSRKSRNKPYNKPSDHRYKVANVCSIFSVPPGDIVGPGFFEDFLTAENTLRKPYGSAEQNMYNFAYTLYNLLYQKLSNQLQSDVLSTALEHLGLSK